MTARYINPNSDLKMVANTSFEEGEKMGMEKGIIKGKIKGEKSKSLEIAKNLKESGVDFELIVKSTGLSKEEIEKL